MVSISIKKLIVVRTIFSPKFYRTVLLILLDSGDGHHQMAVFRCNIVLAVPIITISPAVEMIQQAVSAVARCILGVFKSVPLWNRVSDSKLAGDRPATPPGGENIQREETSVISSELLEAASIDFGLFKSNSNKMLKQGRFSFI